MAPSTLDLISHRLRNQKLTRSSFRRPADVVAWLGAVQAQDYTGAKWALGQRANGLTDVEVDRAFDDGAILRTHVMRPTWHFVTPADIRWMLALTAPRVSALMAHYDRKLELDAAVFARSHAVLERALRGGRHLTRAELAAALARARIVALGQRLGHLMMRAELDGVVCSGPRRGKQFTYALLEERVPPARPLTREEGLAELSKRYFTSHGPATARDYVWWSGLSTRDAKAGIEMVKPAFQRAAQDGMSYWFAPSKAAVPQRPWPFAYLLPNYDEYGIAYKDRDVLMDRSLIVPPTVSIAFQHLVVLNGRYIGGWRRTLTATAAGVAVRPLRSLKKDEVRAIAGEAERYGRFLNLPVTLSQA